MTRRVKVDRPKAIAMMRRGLALADIAACFDCKTGHISRIAIDSGLRRYSPQSIGPERLSRIMQMREKKMSIVQIALVLGVTRNVVDGLIRRARKSA